MGCDIHMYLEYVHWTAPDGEKIWDCLISNAGNRDYEMFGVLAGVRDAEFQRFEPVGIPEGKLSYEVDHAYWMRVTDKEEQKDWEGYCMRGQALAWGNPIIVTEYRNGGVAERTVNPDWHSASWLGYDDFHKALGHYMNHIGPYGLEWAGILGAMRALHDRGSETRVVFWFDN